MAEPDVRQLLGDGLADALGFLGGGLAGAGQADGQCKKGKVFTQRHGELLSC